MFGLGALLARTGYRTASLTTYRQLVAVFPNDPAARICLGNALHQAGEAAAALAEFRAALHAGPGTPEAHQGIGNVLADQGDMEQARRHWALGYRDRVFSAWPYHGTGAPIRVLMPFSVAGGNLRARMVLDDTVFATTAAAMEFWTEDHPLPGHDLILNAIGDADLCGDALARAARLVLLSAAPVINPPDAVARTGREANAARLGRIADVTAPRMTTLKRRELEGAEGARLLAEAGFGFPVLLRSPGFHTGQHFVRVPNAEALAGAAATLAGGDILAIEKLNAAGPDGMARKGRVMIIDGGLYPLHWAACRDWKVHYFTAGMAESAAHRAEEARFLADMPGFLGARAMRAMRAIADALGLDYAGVDFALGTGGKILLFEANAAMVIAPPDEGAMWDYRRPACEAAQRAVRRMVAARGRRSQP